MCDHHDETEMVTASPEDGRRIRECLASSLDLAARLAADDAARIIAGQYVAGVDLGEIRSHHDDVARRLLTDARTDPGRAYARAYAVTASDLLASLNQDQAVARGRSHAACAQPDGTPHPDPLLAERGWQASRGVWRRTGIARPGE